MSRRTIAALAAALAWMATLPATAAPAGTEASIESAAPAEVPQPLSATQSSPSRNQTVEMLLQMQPRTAGLDFSGRTPTNVERPRAADPPAPPVNKAPAGDKPQREASPQGGLFGSGATPMAPTRRVTAEGQGGWPGAAANSGIASDGPRPAHDPPHGRIWLIPREVIEYVRDNREWLAAAAFAILILSWAGSMLLGRFRA